MHNIYVCGARVVQLVSVQPMVRKVPSLIPDDSTSLFQLLSFLRIFKNYL